MISSRQSDLLGLSFSVGAFKFLNLQPDISSIDLNSWGGPFFDGNAPILEFTLFDNSSGGVTTGSGTVLHTAQITGTIAASDDPGDVGTVPEPSSLILAILGLAALDTLRRRS